VELGLHLGGLAEHRPVTRELAPGEGVLGGSGQGAKPLEARCVVPLFGEGGDDLFVDGRGVVAAPVGDVDQSVVEGGSSPAVEGKRPDDCVRVARHVDRVDPSVSRGDLVLDAGLASETLGLDPVRRRRELGRCPPPAHQGVARRDDRDGHSGRRAEGRSRWDACGDLQGEVMVRRDTGFAHRLGEQPMVWRFVADREARPVGGDGDRDPALAGRHRAGDLHAGADREAAHPPVAGEPGVGPASDVTRPHRGLDGDPLGDQLAARSSRPSAWRANRAGSRSWVGSSRSHGQPPNRVRW
jgi:hypothetical protein